MVEKHYKLSLVIPARGEEFLNLTIEDALDRSSEDTEVIVVCDGEWPKQPIKRHPRVTVVSTGKVIGQRAACNMGAHVARSEYIMKIDSHCLFKTGFDQVIIQDMDNYPKRTTMAPLMKNLYAFDWVCDKCGNRWYQGPTPQFCQLENRLKNESCDSKSFHRDIIWQPKSRPNSTAFRFDHTLHFQYFRELKKKQKGDLVESMSLQGSCFVLSKKDWFELDICDEKFGSWGQQGTEVACKTWLSGGQVIINKKTYYAHLFRTQGKDFGFQYKQDENKVERARQFSRDLFFYNRYEKQVRPLSWLIEKFSPVPDWHDKTGEEVLRLVNQEGKKFLIK